MKTFIALLFCLNLCYSQGSCFDVMFENYDITSVSDDHEFIWAGTVNNGLIAYSKVTNDIQFYNTSNSAISSNSILSVLKSNNRLYISTESSLMAFSNDTFQEISTTIQGIMTVAPNGNLAVAAPYEFNILDLDNEITYTKDLLTIVTESCCGKTTDMEYDNDGKLWLSNYGFYEYDIITYDGTIWDVYDVNNTILPIESFYDFNALTVYNGIALATNNGSNMHKYENDIWSIEHTNEMPSIYNDQENIDGMLINAIEFDFDGDLWIGAGDYENTSSGKIAYKYESEWKFVNNNTSDLPGINRFIESQFDENVMYAASNDGLLILYKDCLRLSTEEFLDNANSVVVFPNPTSGILNIKIDTEMPFSYSIINNLGQLVSTQTISIDNKIDVSQLALGHYILKIEFDNTIVKRKILKY